MSEETRTRIPSSFRDPASYLFTDNGRLFRFICPSYREDFAKLMESGLYDKLTAQKLLIPHDKTSDWVIRPEMIPFISYPYEWCFSAYKDAALTTLNIMKTALQYNMVLKDASAYNVQWLRGQPLLIDTTSFAEYVNGQPWVAYQQLCQHFLAPLALMSYRDARLGQLMKVHIDGIPIDLASHLLPKLGVGFSLPLHIHAQARIGGKAKTARKLSMSKASLERVLDNLISVVSGLKLKEPHGGWSRYRTDTSYTSNTATHKKIIVLNFLAKAKPKVVWDLGANDGTYSVLGAAAGAEQVVAFDSDPYCVDLCYRGHHEQGVLPLVLDLTNPSPGIGWANTERLSLVERKNADLVMALALVHHIAIGNNTPLTMIARWFQMLGKWLVVEFVPKEDPQVQKMLACRDDIFQDYTESGFRNAFAAYYNLIEERSLPDSCRKIYLYQAK